jgi:ABC-2 type transport system ATP-binding protein
MHRGRMAFDGMPEPAIERFRELLEQNAVGKARPEQTSRSVEVERVEILDSRGRPLNEMGVGDDFTVRIHLAVRQPVARWLLGFSIDTASGQMALASNSDVLGIELPPLSSDRSFDLRVRDARLNPGSYYVNANFSGVSDPTAHALMGAVEFTVSGTSNALGSVAANVALA